MRELWLPWILWNITNVTVIAVKIPTRGSVRVRNTGYCQFSPVSATAMFRLRVSVKFCIGIAVNNAGGGRKSQDLILAILWIRCFISLFCTDHKQNKFLKGDWLYQFSNCVSVIMRLAVLCSGIVLSHYRYCACDIAANGGNIYAMFRCVSVSCVDHMHAKCTFPGIY